MPAQQDADRMSQSSTRVYEAVWPWRSEQAGAADPTAKPEAPRVIIEAAVMCAAGLILGPVLHRPLVSAVVFTLAALVLAAGLWIHPLYRGFRRAGNRLARAVGIGLSWVLLAPFFYLCFPLGRLFLILGRSDPMRRKFLPKDQTYWSTHRPLPGPEAYRRQY